MTAAERQVKPTAAEQVAGASDLLEEILTRLPAKSLAQSKLVSKQWLSQISNPQFVRLHSRHIRNKLSTGIFLTGPKSICRDADFVPFNALNPSFQTIPSLGFLHDGIKQLVGDFSEIRLLKSCNGLLLCLVTFNESDYYCVCNPTTRKFRLLPRGPFSVKSIRYSYLAFDPSLSLHYKVICTRNSLPDGIYPFGIYIYSSENQCWSTIVSPYDPCRKWFFLNGAMYLLCGENPLSFCVYTEKFERITVPPETDDYLQRFVPASGTHFYCTDREDDATTDFHLLAMRNDFSEWFVKYDVSVSHLLSSYPQIAVLVTEEEYLYSFSAICVVEGVREDETELVLGIPGEVILYNLKEKTVKELYKLRGELDGLTGHWDVKVYQFIESLSDV